MRLTSARTQINIDRTKSKGTERVSLYNKIRMSSSKAASSRGYKAALKKLDPQKSLPELGRNISIVEVEALMANRMLEALPTATWPKQPASADDYEETNQTNESSQSAQNKPIHPIFEASNFPCTDPWQYNAMYPALWLACRLIDEFRDVTLVACLMSGRDFHGRDNQAKRDTIS